MKKIYALLLVLVCFLSVKSQFNCGFNMAQNYLFNTDNTAKARFEQLMIEAEQQQHAGVNKTNAVANYTIPVVFHILHTGGSENISDAQINNAVSILTRDFLKQNADTSNIINQYKNLAANCNIEFRLATKDPNGNCTNGITRHYDPHTNWAVDFSYYKYTWPPSKYLNVYVVKTMQAGAAGYTYLPGSVGANADAVVILSQYVGSIGTANPYVSRALTHEVGHWFNLQHTWGSTNQPGVACGDDGVNDTPITKGHSNCNLSSAACTAGIVENVQNYMEYAYCSNMYTVDQKIRMQNALNSSVGGRNNIWTTANLIATGIINPNIACAPKAEFISSQSVTCIGNTLNFTDYSYNGTINNWKWSSTFAANTSTLQNGNLTFTNSGIAPVQLKVSNSVGADSIIKQFIVVMAGVGSGTTNVIKDFETGVFPDNNWIETTPQYGSNFATYSTSASTGSNCIWVNNFLDNPSEIINFYSPDYNLQNSLNAQLNFKYAYTQQSTANDDRLTVYTSINCGASWVAVYNKSGTALNSTGTIQTTAYLNPSPSEWISEMVNLSSVIGNQNVYFKFEFTSDVNGSGNNIFIDDINISSVVGVKELKIKNYDLKIYPNPANDILNIEWKIENGLLAGLANNHQYTITNSLGQIVKEESISFTHHQSAINICELKSGIYFLHLTRNGQLIATAKIIKQ